MIGYVCHLVSIYLKTYISESSDYSADVSDSIFNQMKKPESEFGKITPVQKRPKKDDQNSNVEFGSLAADLFKDNPTRKLNLSDSDSSESDSDSASSESDDDEPEKTKEISKTTEPQKSETPASSIDETGSDENDEGKDKTGNEVTEIQEKVPNEVESEEKTGSIQTGSDKTGSIQTENEASIHSQLEMSDESDSELCIDAGESQTSSSPKKTQLSPKKMVTSPKTKENGDVTHDESLDLNDYWKKELKKDIDWKDQNSFESLIADITSKRSKPAFARVVALGRIELGLHDDVSKIISSDMLKFILKCHQEQQFHTVELKIQQLIKGMGFSYKKLVKEFFPRAIVNQKPCQN